ncbi:MAG TPA: sugar phosphate nucleotidyltransferase, partial [Candidatus Sulfotelmatobacter sp.]|nr:sugar phosphate nucleotidyltransferase [Candidatus Sulfotelmatobacter sp.]
SFYPKELLTVAFAREAGEAALRPVLAIELALRAMGEAGIARCQVVVSAAKWEVLRYLGDGRRHGVDIAYLVQAEPRGLADAVDRGHAWTRGASVCMAMPDTVLHPADAIGRVKAKLVAAGADLILGVFPSGHPEQQGPVRFAADGRVLEVLDKPAATDLRNTWGVAAWSPAFGTLLHATLAAGGAGAQPALGAIFDLAVRRGLDVRAEYFADGSYVDIGTPEGLHAALALAAHNLEASDP